MCVGVQVGVQVVPVGVQSELRYRNRRLLCDNVYAVWSQHSADDQAADFDGLWSTNAVLRPLSRRRRPRLRGSLCGQDGFTDRSLSFYSQYSLNFRLFFPNISFLTLQLFGIFGHSMPLRLPC